MIKSNLPLMIKNVTCAVTGHRTVSEDFDFEKLKKDLEKIIQSGYSYFLTGMAQGFDLLCFNALLKLKSSYCKMIDGESNILIENYGTIKIKVEKGIATCTLTSDTPDIKVTNLQAQRLLFSYLPTYHTINKSPAFLNAILPLPLSWNLQDRV